MANLGLDSTKLLIYGHNWDDLDYASSILSDEESAPNVGGVAFHCYSDQNGYDRPAQLVEAFPGTEIYFEECTA